MEIFQDNAYTEAYDDIKLENCVHRPAKSQLDRRS